jgi:predicted TIM-barrel fold metal-dependent hydrolase
MIIDGHINLATPDDELDTFGQFLKASGQQPGWESGASLLADMDRDGVELGILLHGDNARRLELVRQHPDRLLAFAGVSMRRLRADQKGALAQARAHIEQGAVGLGEITPYRDGLSLDDPALGALVELAVTLDVPLHVECTATVGEYHPGRVSTPLYDFERLAVRYPTLKLVLSSWGGGLCLYEMMPELPAILTNVYYDTASAVDAFDVGLMLRTVPRVTATRKILYGSGSPLYPRNLEEFRRADAPREVIDGVLGHHMALLLGLSGSKVGARPSPAALRVDMGARGHA